ncbi:MAG: hypothetical protein AB1757_15300 [Acidobacteriota bacterium]
MSETNSQFEQIISQGLLLGIDGKEIKKNLWEEGVYLVSDKFVYHFSASQSRKGVKIIVKGKRTIGEYLRWVDGLFRPGEIPSEANAIHYRAAKKLRELL